MYLLQALAVRKRCIKWLQKAMKTLYIVSLIQVKVWKIVALKYIYV